MHGGGSRAPVNRINKSSVHTRGLYVLYVDDPSQIRDLSDQEESMASAKKKNLYYNKMATLNSSRDTKLYIQIHATQKKSSKLDQNRSKPVFLWIQHAGKWNPNPFLLKAAARSVVVMVVSKGSLTTAPGSACPARHRRCPAPPDPPSAP